MSLLLFLLLACSSSDPVPDFSADRAKLDAWQAGKRALDEGRPDDALSHFRQAQGGGDGDASLMAWEAKALADAGETQAAIRRMGDVLAVAPAYGEARYNRAAWLARLGQLDESAEELRLALPDLQIPPGQVLDDPDFQPHLRDERFSFLPRQTLSAGLSGPEGSVFMGGEVRLQLQVLGAGDEALLIDGPPVTGPVQLLRATEDVRATTEGPMRRVVFALRVTGAGWVEVPTLRVASGGRSTEVTGLRIEALAPEDREGAEPPPTHLRTPSDLRRGGALPGAWRAKGDLLVLTLPTDALAVQAKGGPVTYSYRHDGMPQWVLHRYASAEPGRQVVIRRGGVVVFDQTL